MTERPPATYSVSVADAMDSLDYGEMLALSEMFERWALTETKVDDQHRTELMQWSIDYEAIAKFAGPSWQAAKPEATNGLIPFIARRELRGRS